MTRLDDLRHNLTAMRDRIATAAEAAGRSAEEVTLVAVTKTFPGTDIRLLASIGVADVGENRDQEARAKHAECDDIDVRWHFIGQLQRNKCRSVATYADVVHSVDRSELVRALSRAAQDAQRTLTALAQVALEQPVVPGRGGASPELVLDLADEIEDAAGLTFGGIMAVAPLDADPDAAFARLAEVAAAVRAGHPAANVVSAGMSADLEAAIRHGATHVRVGTALLGHRASPVG